MAKRKTEKSNFIIIILSTLVIVLVAFILLNQFHIKTQTKSQFFVSCQKSNFLPKEDYLPSYTVQRGDTLFTVTTKELGSTSRVNEIVTLNKQNYPDLSITKPFLEVGWKLILPPTNTTKTNGLIFVVAGRVSVSSVGWGVNYLNGGTGPFMLSDLPNTFKTDDCVIVVYSGNDLNNPSGTKVFSITKQ